MTSLTLVGGGPRLARPLPAHPNPARIPPLPIAVPPPIVIALPDGSQVELPGHSWPRPDIWAASERRARAGAPPGIEIRRLTRKEANPLAAAWHPLGAETRPFGYHAFALFVGGAPLALATAGSSHSATVDAELGLARRNTIELTRLCRSEDPNAKGTLRVMLRLWRDFLAVPYWPYFEDTEKVALISYSMPGKAGNVYRFDGWSRARGCTGSGGGGTWSSPSRTGRHPEALWVYWLSGETPPLVAEVMARRRREWQELAQRGGRRPARRAAAQRRAA
jgi:hypothetical protein